VSLEGVYGTAFTLFIKEGAGRREVSVADLSEALRRPLRPTSEARLAEGPIGLRRPRPST